MVGTMQQNDYDIAQGRSLTLGPTFAIFSSGTQGASPTHGLYLQASVEGRAIRSYLCYLHGRQMT